ncbi:MAG TPA: TraC family protein [bacterium]|nr:TraC family protein [bacterium]
MWPFEPPGNLTRELPYWTIRDGAVVLRDGSYRLGFELRLPGTELWDAAQLARSNDQLRTLFNAAVPEGECLRVLLEVHDDCREVLHAHAQVPARPQQERVLELHRRRTAALAAEHDAGRFANYRLVLDLSYHPPRRARRWWTSVDAETYRIHQVELHALREVMTTHCARCGFSACPLDDGGLSAVIWRFFNPGRKRRDRAPSAPVDISLEIPRRLLQTEPSFGRGSLRTALVRSDLHRRWDFLWMDGCAHAVVAMDVLPDRPTTPNLIAPLLELPGSYWLIVEAWNDRRSEQLKRLELKSRLSRQAVLAQDGGDSNARAVEQQVAGALDVMQLTGERVMRVGAAVVVQEPSPERTREAARRALDAFRQIPGVDARIESVALRRQFFQLAPFSGLPNERLLRMLTSNAADFFPCAAPWRGAERPVCLFTTRAHSLVALDPFDPRLPSWNAVVVGESGGGKTHFALAWLSRLLVLEPVVFIVDKGGAYRTFCHVYGGQHVHIDPGADVSINPFALLPGETEPDPAHLGLLRALIALMVAEPGEAPGRREMALIDDAIRQAYARAGGAPVFLHDVCHTLRTFEQAGARGAGTDDWRTAADLAGRLDLWIHDGVYGRLLDRPSTMDLRADIVCFDTEGLDEQYPELAPIVALLANHLIYQRVRSDRGRLKYVVSDETWASLLNRVAAESLVGMFRRFRKFGAGIMAISQRLGDFENEHARGILENAPLKVLTRAADIDRVAPLLNLNDQHRMLWKSLTQRPGVLNEVLVLLDLLEGREGGVVVLREIPEDYLIGTTTAAECLERDRLAAKIGAWPAIDELARRRRERCGSVG